MTGTVTEAGGGAPSGTRRSTTTNRTLDEGVGLQVGEVRVGVPVVLAPMAGVTLPPFRQLCREAGEAALAPERRVSDAVGTHAPAGLYVCEMITSRALVERTPDTMRMITPDPTDPVRSVQLYGVDPVTVAAAVRILVEEDRADHVDLNFGCPVPKVTRKGGGAALPWKADLFTDIVRGAVDAARTASRGRGHEVPVTVKMRMGIDDDHLTYLDAGRAAESAGAAAVALHARTLEQHYSGSARWEAIARLKEAVRTVPVLGNGDLWSAEDAAQMMATTGADGVVVGRGCQGRPWLFTDLVAAATGSPARVRPGLREVTGVLRRHAELMVEHLGDEDRALREMRKHVAWYFKGYPVGGDARRAFALVSTLAELDALVAELDLDSPYPGEGAEGQRGRAGGPKRAHLPDAWLASRDVDDAWAAVLAQAELSVSGG
ncbi:tRNA dihydrouridine synthase DusB [Georgenia sp. Z1491]|uniref:tRNA dihydrouridine synthase DusB n=1 Tax=Georgenia sp. Z1491 TaxID=3416707 RepID=UPI003CF53D2A